ncbi:hypothetical protein ABBQ38_008245 [Trebouxia sp. C0009 RCD-2024]
MSATMLSSPVLSTPARLSTARKQSCRRMQPVCASYRPSAGFNATDAFQQAARQFAQFQKQQQSSAGQQRPQPRGSSARTEAFRGSYGPFQWNFDAEQMNRYMKEFDRAFGGDGSAVPSADTMRDAATCLYFPADLRESSAEYQYLVDLPGVPKSDIKVQVDKDRKLIVSGERKKEEMDVSWRQQKQERRFGAFQRKFQLPEDADVSNIRGKAENGVLTITIRKIPKEDVQSDNTSIPIY